MIRQKKIKRKKKAAPTEEPTTQDILTRIGESIAGTQEALRTLAEAQTTWGKGKGKKGGVPVGGTAEPPLGEGPQEPPEWHDTSFAKPEAAPDFKGNFEVWEKLVNEWKSTFPNLDGRQAPGLLLKALKGSALALARTATEGKLHEPASFQTIMDTIQKHYGGHKGLRRFREFKRLVSVKNTSDNLEEYMRFFEITRDRARDQGLVFSRGHHVLPTPQFQWTPQ